MVTMTRGDRLRLTMIEKYGSLEEYKAHMKEIASKGGKNGTGYGFAHGLLDPVEKGRIGGRISKRTKLTKEEL